MSQSEMRVYDTRHKTAGIGGELMRPGRFVFGVVVLLLIAAGIRMTPDLVRYMKMRSM